MALFFAQFQFKLMKRIEDNTFLDIGVRKPYLTTIGDLRHGDITYIMPLTTNHTPSYFGRRQKLLHSWHGSLSIQGTERAHTLRSLSLSHACKRVHTHVRMIKTLWLGLLMSNTRFCRERDGKKNLVYKVHRKWIHSNHVTIPYIIIILDGTDPRDRDRASSLFGFLSLPWLCVVWYSGFFSRSLLF